ncbi:MAG: integrase arm-type DNA-binding domain-containing protein, partial [Bryobacteraceae bacterium]
YIHVHPAKDGKAVHRSWVFRFVSPATGKTRDMGLGSVDDYSLAEARDKALELRKRVRERVDPIGEKEAQRAARIGATITKAKAKGRTFEAIAEDTIVAMRSGWSANGGSEAQWRQSLADYAFAVLGKMPVDTIETDDVLRILQPIWETKRPTAERIRNRVEKVLDRAGAMKLRTGENPARWKGHLEHLLARAEPTQDEHHKALPWAEMPGFMVKLRAVDSTVARALEFCILTNARPGEVIGNNHGKAPMPWPEIDLEARLWTVPGVGPRKHKSGHIWRCPLNGRAAAILAAGRPADTGADTPVFPGVSLKAPLKLMRQLAGDFEVTVHGSDRSTFSDWAAEEHPTIPEETRKLAVGHWLGDKVDQAYRRGDALALRRRLSQLWDDFCAGKEPAKVVDMQGRAIAAGGAPIRPAEVA